MIVVVLYLAAITASNLLAARYGPAITPYTAFVFIGLDLVARDRLHDRWEERGLWLRLAALIAAGSLLAFAVNRDAGPIATASAVAFAAAGVVDALTYWLLRDRARLVRVNGSNVPAALVDSLVFPTLAFGGFLPLIVVGQFAAKVLGGFVWSLLLAPWWRRRLA